jgi:UDP-N-acetyl-D-mannosaminuronic acid dehydrogenase
MADAARKVCVIGLGYIGLPTSAVLAAAGHHVVGVDVNPKAVETINQGRIHIVEPDLERYVAEAVSKGLLRAQTQPEAAEIFMICVPTPFHHDRAMPEPNMDYVVAASKAIAPYLQPGNIVILESTSPVGSTELVRDTLDEAGVNTEGIHLAYCPERVLPGQIMRELVENDRIVGGLTSEAADQVAAFYRTFVSKGEVLVTDARTAEMSKLVENSFRDVNIAFANELSIICHKAGINPRELIDLANRHPRVNILNPGAGVGGHCIAVDPWFIVAMDPANAKVIRQAREINDGKAEWTRIRIEEEADAFEKANGRPAKIAALGLAFKPNIDDLRESPALEITGKLIAAGYEVLPVEPNLHEHDNLKLRSLDEAMAEADILAFLVSHDQFQGLDVSGKISLDFCGIRGYRTER